MHAGMPLNLPQSFMAGTYALAGKTLMSPPHTFGGIDAIREAAGINRSAAALAMRTYQVLQLPPLRANGDTEFMADCMTAELMLLMRWLAFRRLASLAAPVMDLQRRSGGSCSRQYHVQLRAGRAPPA